MGYSFFIDDKEKMNGNYFVLYKRDAKIEVEKKYGEKMLYDNCKYFEGYNEARSFAFRNIPAIFAKRSSLERVSEKEKLRDVKKPYVVAAEHSGKYKSYDIDGGSEALTTYDTLRSGESELETTIDGLIKDKKDAEHIESVLVGVELKYL